MAKQNERGAIIVEHALALPFFLILIVISVQFLRLTYNHICIQFALTEASRSASIEATSASGANIIDLMTKRLAAFGVPMSAADKLTVCPLSIFNTCAPGTVNRGAPSQPLVYRLQRTVDLLYSPSKQFSYFSSSPLQIQLTAEVMARNEPAI